VDWPLAAVGLSCCALAAGIALKQRRAAACARHDRVAGALATVIAVGCLLAGFALLVSALNERPLGLP